MRECELESLREIEKFSWFVRQVDQFSKRGKWTCIVFRRARSAQGAWTVLVCWAPPNLCRFVPHSSSVPNEAPDFLA